MGKKKLISKNRYMTTHKELKNFTEQVDREVFPDSKFQSAYEKFKRPSYYQLMEAKKK